MTAPVTAPPRAHRLVMRIGVLAGFTSWILVLGLVCIATGRSQYLAPVVLPVLLASLALGLMALAAFEARLPAPGSPRTAFGALVAGVTLASVGVLLLLAEAFVVPVLAADRALGDFVRENGGVLSLPREFALVLLLAGCALLVAALARGQRPA